MDNQIETSPTLQESSDKGQGPLDKYQAWNNYLEEHKDDYPNEEEKSRRGKMSFDYQLSKFYDKYESIGLLKLDTKWNTYVRYYYNHNSLSSHYSQQRLLIIAKAYHKACGHTFTYKLKQTDLPAEFL